MRVEFDPDKNRINRQKHGIDLSLAAEFEFDTALIVIDDRYDYGETRYQALGYIAGRLHMLVFTERGDNVRAISLRRATKYESRKYHEER